MGAVLALTAALASQPASAGTSGAAGNDTNAVPSVPAAATDCPQCPKVPVCAGQPGACGKQPRVIRYSYPSGDLTVEGGGRPGARLKPDDPIAVRVCCVNPYRHAVNVKIDQTTFEELYKPPSQVTSGLLPSEQPAADKNKTTQTKAERAAKNLARPAAHEAVPPAPPDLPTMLKDFNDDADRLVRIDEFATSQRVRVLQIEDPAKLKAASAAAAFAAGNQAIDPDDPDAARKHQSCTSADCPPEALIQLRAELAAHLESDFADLTAVYEREKAADADRAKKVAQLESDAQSKLDLAGKIRTPRSLHQRLMREAADAQRKAATEKAKADAEKLVTPALDDLYAKAVKRHEAFAASRSQRDLQFASAMSAYANVRDQDFGCLLFGPVAATGDEVEITVETPLAGEAANFTLSPEAAPAAAGAGAGSKKPEANKVAAVSQPALIIPVIGSHRPSFSTGIFFTGLVNPTFFKDKDNKARQNNTDRFVPALGAMVHTPLFFPCPPEISFQLSLGVALKDSTPLYLLGPSVIVGRRQRTVITAAIAGGQVNRLSGLKLGDPVTDAQPKTEKVFRYGFLLGLTYNFGPTTPTPSPPSAAKGSGK
jgi:hypothetical protein